MAKKELHPALLRLIRVLAECEADRLCAEKETGPDATTPEPESIEMKRPRTSGEDRGEQIP